MKTRIAKLADKFAQRIDPGVILEEHEGVHPVSYMTHSNLHNLIEDSEELLQLLNEDDDLPQWCDEQISLAKANVSKVLGYVRANKTTQG